MPKAGELSYLQKLGPAGRMHALDKPFSDPLCWRYLIDIGAILSLLPPPPARLLDLGAGSGWTSVFYARRGYDVVGHDLAPDMIELAVENKRRYNIDNLQFLQGDYESMPFDREFDCATFYDALHHAEDERSAIASVYRALRPGGVCVTLEPGEGHGADPSSQEVVRNFGVTERDMPPHLIIAAGRAAGFEEFEVFAPPTLFFPHPPEVPVTPADYYRISSVVRMRK
jgi:SAM-dependent methyltransferase